MKMIQSILFEKPGDQNTDVCIDKWVIAKNNNQCNWRYEWEWI